VVSLLAIGLVCFGLAESSSALAAAGVATVPAAAATPEPTRLDVDSFVEVIDDITDPRRVWTFVRDHGPNVFLIISLAVALGWMTGFFGRRLLKLFGRRGQNSSAAERENRARTLVGVLENAANALIGVGALIMLLEEFGVPIAPLLGGVAVIGLAVAFGAQNLIRDFFAGFMILLENQYAINDVIKVGGISGTVERITLRLTVLRDVDGTTHYIPNGQINTVSNMTQNWARAVINIKIGYDDDLDRAVAELKRIGREMREDPGYRPLILEEPEVLGIQALEDAWVVLQMTIKTLPQQQWTVRREALRRIKQRFEEAGISFAHQRRAAEKKASSPPSAE
jgi:small conductance mechanosensitive channel